MNPRATAGPRQTHEAVCPFSREGWRRAPECARRCAREKSVTRAAHAAAITTTSARSMNRRPVIPVAPGVHLGGLPGDVEAIPLGARCCVS
jgi:hypothetical protein